MGASSTATLSISCRTPLSRSWKSSAFSPVMARPPSVTSASTLTTSTPLRNAGRPYSAAARDSTTTSSATPSSPDLRAQEIERRAEIRRRIGEVGPERLDHAPRRFRRSGARRRRGPPPHVPRASGRATAPAARTVPTEMPRAPPGTAARRPRTAIAARRSRRGTSSRGSARTVRRGGGQPQRPVGVGLAPGDDHDAAEGGARPLRRRIAGERVLEVLAASSSARRASAVRARCASADSAERARDGGADFVGQTQRERRPRLRPAFRLGEPGQRCSSG